MKKYISILLATYCMFASINTSSAFELILPKAKKNTVSSNYALFVGNQKNGTISINNNSIYTAPNGAFAHSVKLKEGENRIIVRSDYKTRVFTFYKQPVTKAKSNQNFEFKTKVAIVKKDNTPLRSTPIDGGLNRISHLFKDTTILINGSNNEFYRVFLSKDKTAWIAKKDIEFIDSENSNNIGEFVNTNSKKYKNAVIQTISFTKNLPYTIDMEENEILFKIYNPEFSENSVYTLNIPKLNKYYYQVKLEDGQYTFKVNSIPKTLKENIIVIDAGHGGSEKGAVGCLGDYEKDINLKIALELERQLKAIGANVLLTRDNDKYVSLEDRIKFAQENNANIFISIHLNSIPDIPISLHKHRGTSVYYFNPNSKDLAEIIEKNVTKSANTKNDKVRTASFAVIRPTDYIGILIENAYMINPLDSMLYTTDSFAQNISTGIVNGLLEYIEEK